MAADSTVGFEKPPTQVEFARLELDYTIVSKRKLLRLVNEGHVSGWDDPRMPTMAGLRRRGGPPKAIRDFDINDYKTKSELTRIKLYTTVTAAIRYKNLIGQRFLALARR